MAHHEPPVTVDGPEHPRAFEGIPVRRRSGLLDTKCHVCGGRGQWNTEIHAHFRSKRQACHECLGDGWLETSGDATAVADIILVNGHAQWITRWVPFDHSQKDPEGRSLIPVDVKPDSARTGGEGKS